MKVKNMRKVICKNCGVVNEFLDEALAEGDDWLECTLPEGFEWILPTGKITPIFGDSLYISSLGEHLSYNAYLDKYNIDPEIAYQLMRGSIHARSVAMAHTSKQKPAETVSSKGRSQNWLDDDDWIS